MKYRVVQIDNESGYEPLNSENGLSVNSENFGATHFQVSGIKIFTIYLKRIESVD